MTGPVEQREREEISYKAYWLHSPHCGGSYPVRCNDNTVAHICRHPVVAGKELPHTDQFQSGKSRFSFLTAWLSGFR